MKEITREEYINMLELFDARPGLVTTLTDAPYEVCWSAISLSGARNLADLIKAEGKIPEELSRSLGLFMPKKYMRYYSPSAGILRADCTCKSSPDGSVVSRIEFDTSVEPATISIYKKGLSRSNPIPSRVIDKNGVVVQQAYLGYTQKYMQRAHELINGDTLEIEDTVEIKDDVVAARTQTTHHAHAVHNEIYTDGSSLMKVVNNHDVLSWGPMGATAEIAINVAHWNAGHLHSNVWEWRNDIFISKRGNESKRTVEYGSFFRSNGLPGLYAKSRSIDGEVKSPYAIVTKGDGNGGMIVNYVKIDEAGKVTEDYISYRVPGFVAEVGHFVQRQYPDKAVAKLDELGSKMTGEPKDTKVYYINSDDHEFDNDWFFGMTKATPINPRGLIAVHLNNPAPESIRESDYNNIVFISRDMIFGFEAKQLN
ncbi:hypothetical protein [Vibrio phage BONAISHI]|nr:hypothetical protein [Vibrio phage BONAISHI]